MKTFDDEVSAMAIADSRLVNDDLSLEGVPFDDDVSMRRRAVSEKSMKIAFRSTLACRVV